MSDAPTPTSLQPPHALRRRRRRPRARGRGRRGARERPRRAPSPGPRRLLRSFARPGTATAAGFRWWWPNGLVDPREIGREVDQIADADFGVLEIADVTHSLNARGITMDLRRYGWGTTAWVAGVKAALERGARRDVRIDITVGPSWPAAVPTITPDDDAACTERSPTGAPTSPPVRRTTDRCPSPSYRRRRGPRRSTSSPCPRSGSPPRRPR